MAQENRWWGAERIRGELLKLGLSVAKHTIQQYIGRVRPEKSVAQAWAIFSNNHAKDIWACDILPMLHIGFHRVYLFFIVELASQRIAHFRAARSPTDAWAAQQLCEATPTGQAPRFFTRDRANKYGPAFAWVALALSFDSRNTLDWAPKANAIGERFLGNIRSECLDYLLVLGEQYWYRVMRENMESLSRATAPAN